MSKITTHTSGIFECTSAMRYEKRISFEDMDYPGGQKYRVLQQAWQDRSSGDVEWRDVETVKSQELLDRESECEAEYAAYLLKKSQAAHQTE